MNRIAHLLAVAALAAVAAFVLATLPGCGTVTLTDVERKAVLAMQAAQCVEPLIDELKATQARPLDLKDPYPDAGAK